MDRGRVGIVVATALLLNKYKEVIPLCKKTLA